MKQVIRITEVEEPKKELKPIEFTHYLYGTKGWIAVNDSPRVFEKIVYLGDCQTDGDMFATYADNGAIGIYKGDLNDGVY